MMRTFVCVCLSVRLSVCPRAYVRSHMRDLYYFLCMMPMTVEILLRQGDKIPREMDDFEVFLPLDNAL